MKVQNIHFPRATAIQLIYKFTKDQEIIQKISGDLFEIFDNSNVNFDAVSKLIYYSTPILANIDSLGEQYAYLKKFNPYTKIKLLLWKKILYVTGPNKTLRLSSTVCHTNGQHT